MRQRLQAAEDIAYILLNKPEPESETESDQVLYIIEPGPDNEVEPESFPRSGWLRGSVADIATAIRVRATPVSKIDAAADLLEKRIEIAAQQLETQLKSVPASEQKSRHPFSEGWRTDFTDGDAYRHQRLCVPERSRG